MDDRHARHRATDVDPRRRPSDGFRAQSRARFTRLAVDAVGALPPSLLAELDGVAVRVRDLPDVPAAQDDGDGPALVRFHPGERGVGLLDVYRRPLEARATSRQDLSELIRDVATAELAGHLGLDDGPDGGW